MMRWVYLFALLPAFSVAPLVVPAAAQEACTTWSAQMQEDEGGPVLTASACAADRPDAYLSLTCSARTIWIRYDLSVGAEASPNFDGATDVVFTFGERRVTLSMRYEDMDARHAADVPADGELVGLLQSGTMLSIADGPGRYPSHDFSLTGSSAAIGKLLAACR